MVAIDLPDHRLPTAPFVRIMIAVERSAAARPHFVVKARSRRPRSAATLDALRTAAERVFPGAGWSLTCGPGDAVRLARAAALAGADLVVAVGGDGTINEVVNGILTAPGAAAALGVVPAGSGCDFARSIGVPRDAARAVAALADGRLRRIDVGKISCAPLDHPGAREATERYFVNMAGCGASARVADRFNRGRTPGALGYAAATALTALDYRFPQVEIQTDSDAARRVTLNAFFICNGEYCGGGMRVGRGARLDDGLLTVVEAAGVGRLRTIVEWPRLYRGHLARVSGVRVIPARRVHVASEEDVLVDCDGEVCGRLPATYTIVPGAIAIAA